MASLIERVPVRRGLSLADYEAVAEHAQAVRELKAAAEAVAPPLGGRTVWMMNSTSQGGGVAEMLPGEVSMLRQLGIDAPWLALSISEAGFFDVTKRVHNLIHGQREAPLTNEDRELYERISRHVATELRDVVRPNDIVIVHDPQPLAAGSFLAATVEAYFIWRCHIGLDVPSDAADAAWSFLQPYTNSYQQAIFSAQEYVPDFLSDRSTIIHP
ncbi:MAG: glycosyltransferase, partial [Gemmatimonadota bacterium]